MDAARARPVSAVRPGSLVELDPGVPDISAPATPDSASFGNSGSSGERLGVVIASARSCPISARRRSGRDMERLLGCVSTGVGRSVAGSGAG
jgi:hypothetical protein